ncbi:MAG: LysE family translocator [Chloroflexi bacterium]|nr:LysE family translocator [Chloroflexota bacterium]
MSDPAGLSVLGRGLLLGFSIAAPVGPIGVLCIRRTLAQGRLVGFASGLGAATADALYGSIAAFGLTVISGALIGAQVGLRLVGGLFLCYLGIRTLLARPADVAANASGRSLPGAFASTLALTLTNPITILSFAAVFAGLGVGSTGYTSAAALTVLGVFLGSAFWWLLLSGGVSLLRNRFDHRAMRWVNRLSGAVILGFGLLALLSFVGTIR